MAPVPQAPALRSSPFDPRWPWLCWFSVAVYSGFCWLPLSYYRMVGWPWMVLWQGGGLALLIGIMVRLRQWQRPFYRLGHGLDSWLLALGVALALSTLASPFPRVALGNASLVASYGLGFYAYRNWVDRGWLTRRRLWLGLVTVATGVALISLALWQPEASPWDSQNFFTALRNHHPLGHHNFVGGYLVLMLPLVVAAARALSGGGRWVTALAAGIITLALYVSGSRGAALGLVVWLGGTWLSGLVRARGRRRWQWGGAGVMIFGVVGLALATNPRIRSWFGSVGTADGPTLDRWFMLRLGGNILRDRPLVGVGPGVMSRVSNLYRPIETGAGLDHIQQLHNTPAQLAGELGLPGLALYLAGIFLIGRLGWYLWRLPLASADRRLLGGIGGAFLAYGVSSLTDYQLENIPIAGSLVALVVLLVSLADAYGLPKPEVQPDYRRMASLAVWAWVGLVVYLWLPFSLAVGFGTWAKASFDTQAINLADVQWHKATILSPWDPTAAAVASESLYDLDETLGDSDAKDNVRTLAIDYAHQAQAAAPNDVWFNQNLAVLYQRDHPDRALPYAQQALRLLPRNRNHGYWLLGEVLVATEQTPQAIAAFTLEALVNPASLTYPLWRDPFLAPLYPAVVAKTLAEYDLLLTEVDPQPPGYGLLYETRALLGWWTDQPINALELDRLRPILQALFLAETHPAAALSRLETLIAQEASPPNLLLAAWIDPAIHWPAYTQAVSDSSTDSVHAPWPDPVDIDTLRLADTLATRPLRAWLTSLPHPPDRSYRGGLTFAYRNAQAEHITQILTPPSLQTHWVIQQLGLFQPWPREFPALDRHVVRLQAEALAIPSAPRSP